MESEVVFAFEIRANVDEEYKVPASKPDVAVNHALAGVFGRLGESINVVLTYQREERDAGVDIAGAVAEMVQVIYILLEEMQGYLDEAELGGVEAFELPGALKEAMLDLGIVWPRDA